MRRKSLAGRSLLWVTGSAVGVVVVALPDSEERVLSLSSTHGPAPVDLLGVAVVVGSWLPIALCLPSLWREAAIAPTRLATAAAVLGAVGLVITIGADLGWTWLVAVAALVAAQVLLIASGLRTGASTEGG